MTVFVEFICDQCGTLAEDELDDDYADVELERSRTCVACLNPTLEC